MVYINIFHPDSAWLIVSDDFSSWRKYLKQAGGRGGRHKAPFVGCRGKAPAGGMGAKPPSAEDKLHSEGPRLP